MSEEGGLSRARRVSRYFRDGDRQLARTELRDEIIRLKNVDGVFNIIDKDK